MQLQAMRKQRGLSQADLAKVSGIAQSSISYIESGEKSPSLKTITKLASGLDVTVSALLESNSILTKNEVTVNAQKAHESGR